MSVDMNSQGSDSNEEDYDPNCEEEEEEDEDPGDIEDYYVGVASDVEQQGADAFDPEEYQFTCLTYKESEGALNEHMTSLASVLKTEKSKNKKNLEQRCGNKEKEESRNTAQEDPQPWWNPRQSPGRIMTVEVALIYDGSGTMEVMPLMLTAISCILPMALENTVATCTGQRPLTLYGRKIGTPILSEFLSVDQARTTLQVHGSLMKTKIENREIHGNHQDCKNVSHSVAKLILVNFHWQVSEILDRYKSNSAQLLVEARVQPNPSKHVSTSHPPHHCAVCMQFVRKENLLSLACQHQFCRSCWEQHCSVLVKDGVGVGVSCMAQDCPLRTPEDFVFPLLPNEELREKYRRYLFRDYVESHYQLQLCPGADCPMVIRVQEPRARRVQCNRCNEVFWVIRCIMTLQILQVLAFVHLCVHVWLGDQMRLPEVDHSPALGLN
ncbi:E3 ubiquitin-protein ligase arih2 [Saguinus oedipus]|uniref:RBR-type E3 ubiquitin transferase n=1 Tax=Saguinus oedipus TaxID=9490 RepID=A0ABQ9U221_SAGOE|nr:E3 ubiquitin-protein ligase arih2 [Saguinus oedipus]